MKLIKYLLIFFTIFFLIPLGSAAQYYYAPNEGLNLALNEKKDFKASFAAGSNTVTGNVFSYQLGYSPIKYLGLQSSYASFKVKNGFNDRSASGYIANAAIGAYYFWSFKKQDSDNLPMNNKDRMARGFLLDIYTGYGYGNRRNQHDVLIRSDLGFSKKFIQGGVHWQGKVTGIDFVMKYGVIDYQSATVSGSKEQPISEVNNIIFYNSYNFIENSLRLQIGLGKKVRFFFTQTWLKLSYKDKVNVIDDAYNFGIIWDIDDFF